MAIYKLFPSSDASIYSGYPAIEARDWRKQAVLTRKLPDILERLKSLEKKIEKILFIF